MATRQWKGTDVSVPTDFDDTDNWVQAAVPVNGDDAYFDENSAGAGGVAGEDKSAITLASLNVKMTNLYPVGTNGTPLKIKTAICNIGDPSQSATTAAGTGRVNLDLSTTALTLNIKDSAAASTDTGKEPVRVKCVNAANIVNASGGRSGIATDAIGDVATVGTINVTGSNAVFNIGTGTTYTNLNISAGTVKAYAGGASTNISYDGGSLTADGSFVIGTLNASGRNAVLNNRRTQNVVTIARSGQVATVAWTGHGLSIGDMFMVMGANEVQYNGVKVVATVPDANSVTFFVNSTPTATATGTITASLMAVTNLYLFDGAAVDISASALSFPVGYIYLDGDATIKVNPANPNHFGYGYLIRNRGKLDIIG